MRPRDEPFFPFLDLPDPCHPDWLEIMYENFPDARPPIPEDYWVVDLTQEPYGIMGCRPADELLSSEEYSNVPRINAFPEWDPVGRETPVINLSTQTSTPTPVVNEKPVPREIIDLTDEPIVNESFSTPTGIDSTRQPGAKEKFSPREYIILVEEFDSLVQETLSTSTVIKSTEQRCNCVKRKPSPPVIIDLTEREDYTPAWMISSGLAAW